ncbi:uncharacterized protein LOC113549733 isoform X1 [Rhopalosiphum maidis]|uniref:uncharacterized protein LOC113549733 isoform X1 n=1 Tax=Rhopalosiphum maidis TaxID=43146 RepID=UPI000EFE3B32|nr:uncharacterized protein LOC113549733 isoform X1 [Rhopalosiphum maidis]
MAKSECFFGFLNVCGCALSIATFNMGFFSLCVIIIIILLYKEDKLMITDQTFAKFFKIIAILLLLFLLHLILYFNNKLKKATFVHNILFIRQWLMFHCIFYTLLSTLLCYYLFINLHYKIVIVTVIIIIITEIYQIHIVRRFYNNELEHLATSSCNADKTRCFNFTPIQMEEISVKYTQYKCIKMPN